MDAVDQEIVDAVSHEDDAFGRAITAVVRADSEELSVLLTQLPDLVRQRSNSSHRATLLHYVASNAVEDALQLSPQSIYNQLKRCSQPDQRHALVQRAITTVKILLAAGAEVDAVADAYGGGNAQTPMNWLVSSDHPFQAGILDDLTKTLCQAGANLDGLDGDSSPVMTALGFGHPSTAGVLFDHGCRRDNLLLAAAAGDLAEVRGYRIDNEWHPGNTVRCDSHWFRLPTEPKRIAELGLVLAAMSGHADIVRYMIEQNVDRDAMPAGTHMMSAPLHTACLAGQTSVVDELIEMGCDPTRIDARYESNALSWARHGGVPEIVRKIGQYVPQFRRRTEGATAEIRALTEAVFSGDVQRLQNVLAQTTYTPKQLNGPWFHFDAPAVVCAKDNLSMIDCLLAAGADLNQKSHWWAGGFGVLDDTETELADALIERGAQVDAWSAAALGYQDRLESIIVDDPQMVHARGPDGKTPLHCATSVPIAEHLISRGADVDAKCIDHESTPAQYLVAEHPEVVRCLLDHGCRPDIMLAAALGDISLIQQILSVEHDALSATIDREHFPSSAADNIYSWTLGWYMTAHQVAHRFGHSECVQFLFSQSPASICLLNACLLGDDTWMGNSSVVSIDPAKDADPKLHQHVAHAARNNRPDQVQRLLQAGFSVNAPGQHRTTALHWGAFHGNVDLVDAVLAHGPALDAVDTEFNSTPLEWAIHGSSHGWYIDQGDYPGVLRRLLAAGCRVPSEFRPTGNVEIDALFETP